MNNGAIFIAFSLGATIGSVVTWRVLKNKYEQIAQEEIDSVKEVFSRRQAELEAKNGDQESITTARKIEEKPSIRDYAAKLQEQSYVNYADIAKSDDEEEETMDKPYVIEPEEFGEEDGYKVKSLTYYADGVLTDERDKVINDVDSLVGLDSLNHFGEYQDDSVFVRNDGLRTDFEILADTRNYSDVIADED